MVEKSKKIHIRGQGVCLPPELREEDHEFKASLGYIVRSFSKSKNNKLGLVAHTFNFSTPEGDRIRVQGQAGQKVNKTPSQPMAGCSSTCLPSQLYKKHYYQDLGGIKHLLFWC
jgi:hypothetical protein